MKSKFFLARSFCGFVLMSLQILMALADRQVFTHHPDSVKLKNPIVIVGSGPAGFLPHIESSWIKH